MSSFRAMAYLRARATASGESFSLGMASLMRKKGPLPACWSQKTQKTVMT